MHATEIIRDILNLIDKIEGTSSDLNLANDEEEIVVCDNDEDRRFKQILDLLNQSYQLYDNSPNEVVASLDAVTVNAGGGWNGPKNPADLRADSFSMYPNYQHRP